MAIERWEDRFRRYVRADIDAAAEQFFGRPYVWTIACRKPCRW
jgi:hypothetical protein